MKGCKEREISDACIKPGICILAIRGTRRCVKLSIVPVCLPDSPAAADFHISRIRDQF